MSRIAKLTVPAIPRAKTKSEKREFVQAVIDAKTIRLLRYTILSSEAGEMLGTGQTTIIAGLPLTILRDVVFSHPTMIKGFNNLLANLGPKSKEHL